MSREDFSDFNTNVDDIITSFAEFEKNIVKFRDKGSKLAARKSRVALLRVWKLSKILRKQVQERKKKQKYIVKYGYDPFQKIL